MEKLKYGIKFKHYLKMPLYMIPIFVFENVLLFIYDHNRMGFIFIICLVLYTIGAVVLYIINKKNLDDSILNFATSYATVQKKILDNLDVPYALVSSDGRFLWMNKQFVSITGKEKTYQKSVTTIFPEITRELIEKHAEDEDFEFDIEYNNKKFHSVFRKVEAQPMEREDMVGFDENSNILYAFILYDNTEIYEVKKINEERKMVTALVYVDNYEEIVESVESVRLSIIRAVIERKVYKYFQDKKALVRRMDRDKYLVVTDQKGLAEMEQDKFAIIESMKSVKGGNDMSVTISIGIGANGPSYMENAEFARVAIGLALGRGGSQAVIKDGEEISYYSAHGKEKEKTTRVKARVKAQALRELMQTRETVYIMGHQISDVDSFGAAIGIYCAAKEIGKTAYIILNTVTSSLRPIVDLFVEENGYDEEMFIDSTRALIEQNSKSLVVVVDTNRPSYTECPELLERSESVVVFDHHRSGTDVIKNPLLSYIEPYASSTCEMVAEMLPYFSEKIELKSQEADAIYAGILIDTNNFMTKTGVRTFEAAAYLKRAGVEVTRVRKLLREDMDAYKARASVVRHAVVYRKAFAISICENEKVESPTIVGAQAANELLNIVGIKASFVLTEYDSKIYISSRSIDEIDVQKIMEHLGGGGHLNVAGAQIKGFTIEQVKKMITDVLDSMIEEGEIKL